MIESKPQSEVHLNQLVSLSTETLEDTGERMTSVCHDRFDPWSPPKDTGERMTSVW
jgi:hypothetical protein